jgi:hypothetical protein
MRNIKTKKRYQARYEGSGRAKAQKSREDDKQHTSPLPFKVAGKPHLISGSTLCVIFHLSYFFYNHNGFFMTRLLLLLKGPKDLNVYVSLISYMPC